MGDRVHSPGKHKRLCDCGVMVTCNLAKVESPVRFWAVAPSLLQWSETVSRLAHNQEIVGATPTTATKFGQCVVGKDSFDLFCSLPAKFGDERPCHHYSYSRPRQVWAVCGIGYGFSFCCPPRRRLWFAHRNRKSGSSARVDDRSRGCSRWKQKREP